MKSLIALLLVVSSFNVFSNAVTQRVNRCHDINYNLEDATRCADLALARGIERLQMLVSGGGSAPSQDTIVYGCSSDGDPIMQRMIISESGDILRTSNLKTFSAGGDDDEWRDCGASVAKQTFQISTNMRSECQCSSDGDPLLQLVLMNSSYQVVRKINMAKFTDGGDSEERRDCEVAARTLPMCQTNF